MDLAIYLEHLQTVFKKFDVNAIILKPVLIRLFCNSLEPSIYFQTNQDGCRKDTWE